ncbi:MAG: propanediol utilization protein [Alphaproteobacteria bacterium]|nr:propanediol utilization protein [Alphaproteobacteria bacterium]
MTAMMIKVTTTGTSRSGISAKQKPYTMATAYAHLPNIPFPQEFSYYCETPQQVQPAGEYECEVVLSIKDGRINVEVDPRQGRKLSAPAAARPAATA